MKCKSYEEYLARYKEVDENRARSEATFEHAKHEAQDAMTHGESREQVDGLLKQVDDAEAIKNYWNEELKELKADNPALEGRRDGAERVEQMNAEVDAAYEKIESGANVAYQFGKALKDLKDVSHGEPVPQPETEINVEERLALVRDGMDYYVEQGRQALGGKSNEEINFEAVTSPRSPDMNRPHEQDPLAQYRADINGGIERGQSRADAEQGASANLYEKLTGNAWEHNNKETLGMAVERELGGRYGNEIRETYGEIRDACQGRQALDHNPGIGQIESNLQQNINEAPTPSVAAMHVPGGTATASNVDTLVAPPPPPPPPPPPANDNTLQP